MPIGSAALKASYAAEYNLFPVEPAGAEDQSQCRQSEEDQEDLGHQQGRNRAGDDLLGGQRDVEYGDQGGGRVQFDARKYADQDGDDDHDIKRSDDALGLLVRFGKNRNREQDGGEKGAEGDDHRKKQQQRLPLDQLEDPA